MELVLTDTNDLLDFLSNEGTQSLEDFICYLEDALESGELTIDEVAQRMNDFTGR